MSAIVGGLLEALLLYKYGLLFVVIFLDAIYLPAVPINSLLLATGAFASQGYFSFWLSFIVVLFANVAGDSVDYVLAARYGETVLTKLRIAKFKYLRAVELLVRRHPGWTIFFTRFTNTLDNIVNVLAGIAKVPYRTFFLYDVLGNGISLGGVLVIGYIVGANWMAVVGFVETFFWVISIVVILIALVAIFGRQLGLHRLPIIRRMRRFLDELEEETSL